MSGFTKLVPEIIQSSIWNESPEIRVVWITLLAIKDEEGYVRGDVATIARLANIPLEKTAEALKKFQEPDPHSHTPDHDGRRVMSTTGGYVIVNHDRYRRGTKNGAENRTENEGRNRTEYMREYARRQRYKQEGRKKKTTSASNVNSLLNVDSTNSSVSVSVSEYGFRKRGKGGEEVPLFPYGELQSVLLTKNEYALLVQKHGEAKTLAAIEILDSYVSSKGAKYRDHYAVLKSGGWVWKRMEEDQRNGNRQPSRQPPGHQHTSTFLKPPDGKYGEDKCGF